MDKYGERILFKLSGAVPGGVQGACPSLEDISALIDGTIEKERKEKLQSHISSCEICYETYISALELTDTEGKKSLRIFSPLSVAASIFIALLAFVIFYKVNISVTDIEDTASPFVKAPVFTKEGKVEHKSVKRTAADVNKKIKKKQMLKTPAPEKSTKVEKDEEVVSEDEVPEMKDEPSVVRSKNVLRNTQGISRGITEPAAQPAGFSVGSIQVESEKSDQKSGRVSSQKKKGGKGLVDKLKENEKRERDISSDMNCFSREGGKYKRRDEFMSEIPLRDTFPEIVNFVQPENYKADEQIVKPVYIILEVITNSDGGVTKICVAGGSTGNIKPVIDALKKWKFKIQGDSPSRFRLVLGISGNRIIEVLDKK